MQFSFRDNPFDKSRLEGVMRLPAILAGMFGMASLVLVGILFLAVHALTTPAHHDEPCHSVAVEP